MQIKVNTPSKYLTLDVEATDSIETVKVMIQDKEGIPTDQQIIIFRSKQLEDGKAVSGYDIKEGSKLHLLIRQKEGMQIFVVTLTERAFSLDVEPSETIANVEAKIQEKDAFTGFGLRLFLPGKHLDDEKTLSDYNITNKAILILLLRCLGCAERHKNKGHNH